MGLEKMIKREISITIATVLLVTTVFLMFSYAIFKVDVSGDTNVITFGDVAMSFCKDSTCNSTIPNIGNVIGTTIEDGITKYVPIYPVEKSENEEWTQEDYAKLSPYIFTLTNDGTLGLYVTIFLNRDTTPGLSYTVDNVIYKDPVDDDQIMIAIGEQGNIPTKMLYSTTKNDTTGGQIIAAEIELKPGETKIMNLYAWLKSDAENAAQGKYFVSQISARGEFIPED
ncbi:MAG: hypothetical protein HFE04_02785 [Bacilli bacterium]|nr:hypothetical protein [Bacilli bacterium]